MDNRKECIKCGALVSKFAYNRHLQSCTGDLKNFKGGFKEKVEYIFTGTCKYCGKECKNSNSQANHERLCPKNENRVYTNGMQGKEAWNKGLTKETDERVKQARKTYRFNFENKKFIGSMSGKHHSDKTKRKLSEIRIKYLKDNPEKVPYLLSHSSKGASYPEKYWLDLIKNEKIDLFYHKQIGLYELDFYNDSKKIDFEIDGDQHYLDKKIVESDKKRTIFLQSLGWTVIRLRWSIWQKKDDKEKKLFISFLKDLIDKTSIK